MWGQFLRSTMMVTIAVAAVGGIISVSVMRTSAQAPVPMKTPWGEPDLQGIWTDETDTPLQRSAQVREPGILHRGTARRIGQSSEAAHFGRDKRVGARDRELDVARRLQRRRS